MSLSTLMTLATGRFFALGRLLIYNGLCFHRLGVIDDLLLRGLGMKSRAVCSCAAGTSRASSISILLHGGGGPVGCLCKSAASGRS